MDVVHRLEVIEVQQQKDKIVDVAAVEITDIHLDNPLQDGSFRQLGQLVEIADFFQQMLLLHLLGDLGQAAHGETYLVLDKDLDVGLVLQPDLFPPRQGQLVDTLHRPGPFHFLAQAGLLATQFRPRHDILLDLALPIRVTVKPSIDDTLPKNLVDFPPLAAEKGEKPRADVFIPDDLLVLAPGGDIGDDRRGNLLQCDQGGDTLRQPPAKPLRKPARENLAARPGQIGRHCPSLALAHGPPTFTRRLRRHGGGTPRTTMAAAARPKAC